MPVFEIKPEMLEELSFTQQQNLALCIARLAENKKDFSDFCNIINFFFVLVNASNLSERMKQIFSEEMDELKKDDNFDIEKIDQETKELYDSLIFDSEQSLQLLRILTIKKVFFFSELVLKIFFERQYLKKSKNEKLYEQLNNISQTKKIAEILSLNDKEKLLLNVIYTFYSCDASFIFLLELLETKKLSRIYTTCAGLSLADVRYAFSDKSQLMIANILDDEYYLTENAYKCIRSGNFNNFFSNCLKQDKNFNFQIKDFDVNNEQTDFAIRLIKSNVSANIILYGDNDYTKVAFAHTLVKETKNIPVLFSANAENENNNSIDDDDDDDDYDFFNSTDRIYSKLKAVLKNQNKNLLIVKDVDSIFSSPRRGVFSRRRTQITDSKIRKVKNLLQISKRPIIWIFKDIQQIDKSVLEYFTFSMQVGTITPSIKKVLIKSELEKYSDFFEKNKFTKLKAKVISTFESQNFSLEKIQNILSIITKLNSDLQKESSFIKDFDLLVRNNSILNTEKTKMREKVKATYDLSVLNTSTDADQIVKMVKNAYKKSKDSNLSPSELGIRLLFYGLSGTGKTELARYIAQELGKEISLYRTSDIKDKYVGESEKNVSNAFAEAESSGNILLFDEADSFFYNREGAQRSWERSLVNEFLTQMEEFSGILICTTNLKQIMDPAMNRRFHIITEFMALTQEGISSLLNNFFGDCVFSEEQILTLAKYESVTPGDFSALYSKLRFCDDDITSETVVKELCKIQDEKEGVTRKIGFC